jgi:hypothetical protein
MKELSLRQAQRCEEAREPVCKCRCGGRLHGAKRNGGSASFFGELPEDDPHHVDTPAQKREKRNAKKRAETEARFEARMKYLGGLTS